MRSAMLAAILLLAYIPSSAAAQEDNPPPLQAGERSMQISTPDGSITYYACITTGMHPGQGQAGPGYDAVTYNIPVIIQVQPGNGLGSQANANMEGIACRLMYQGDQPFDVTTGKLFPPPP